jgi:hypothetical protein
MGAAAGAGVFAGGDGLIGGGFMEGLCPSKPPRQRPGGLWKPGFGVGFPLLEFSVRRHHDIDR